MLFVIVVSGRSRPDVAVSWLSQFRLLRVDFYYFVVVVADYTNKVLSAQSQNGLRNRSTAFLPSVRLSVACLSTVVSVYPDRVCFLILIISYKALRTFWFSSSLHRVSPETRIPRRCRAGVPRKRLSNVFQSVFSEFSAA